MLLPETIGPAQIKVVQGDEQVARPGARLADPLVVRLVDNDGQGMSERPVAWVVNTGGGTINPEASLTDSEGFASAVWTLGPEAGPNTAQAQIDGIGSVTFTALGTGGGGGGGGDGGDVAPSASRSRIAAEPASIRADEETATIVVTVLDGDGDPVSGATVTLQATGAGNNLTQPVGTTGADGIAVGSLFSSAPGDKIVSATINGSVALERTTTVTVTSGPEPPAPPPSADVEDLKFLVQPPREVKKGRTFTVEVALVDDDEDVVPLSGIVIYLGLFPDGKDTPTNEELEGNRFEPTQNGVATFRLAVEKKGKYRLRARTDDLPQYGARWPDKDVLTREFKVD